MGENYKIIVAHPGKQHSFRLATALKNDTMLFKYISTVYDKKSSILMKIIKKLSNTDDLNRINNRKCEELNDEEVLQFYELFGLLEILINRYDKKGEISRLWHGWTSSFFGKLVARYAIENDVNAVIMYDTNSKECFKILKEKAPHIKRIMDVAAANKVYMKTVYEEDIERTPLFSEKLQREVAYCWNAKRMAYYKEEVSLAEYFLVPSTFVQMSLEFSGISKNKIYVCPYGSNFINNSKSEYKKKDGKLSILYVGNVTQLKGISYLLEGLKSFSSEEIEVNIVGNYDNSDGIFNDYINEYNFVGRVAHEEVLDFYKKADIFLFPSLGEGMSLAGLEAMGCGLPIICSVNSGVNDLVIDGINGFVIPIGDKNAIKEKVKWFLDNKSEIPRMSQNAREIASEYTWDNYADNATKIIKEMLCERSK